MASKAVACDGGQVVFIQRFEALPVKRVSRGFVSEVLAIASEVHVSDLLQAKDNPRARNIG